MPSAGSRGDAAPRAPPARAPAGSAALCVRDNANYTGVSTSYGAFQAFGLSEHQVYKKNLKCIPKLQNAAGTVKWKEKRLFCRVGAADRDPPCPLLRCAAGRCGHTLPSDTAKVFRSFRETFSKS